MQKTERLIQKYIISTLIHPLWLLHLFVLILSHYFSILIQQRFRKLLDSFYYPILALPDFFLFAFNRLHPHVVAPALPAQLIGLIVHKIDAMT